MAVNVQQQVESQIRATGVELFLRQMNEVAAAAKMAGTAMDGLKAHQAVVRQARTAAAGTGAGKPAALEMLAAKQVAEVEKQMAREKAGISRTAAKQVAEVEKSANRDRIAEERRTAAELKRINERIFQDRLRNALEAKKQQAARGTGLNTKIGAGGAFMESVGTAGMVVGGVAAAAAGIAAVAGGIAELGAKAQNTKNLIAGMVQTLGYTSSFNQGLDLAGSLYQKINVAAAKLPGEAQDYLNVFTTSLPQVAGAIGGTTSQMVDFTNTFTAELVSMGVDSNEAALGLSKMLAVGKGLGGMHITAVAKIMPYIIEATKGTKEQVNSIEEFNKLSQKQRGHILQMTTASHGLKDMIDAAGQGWDAQTGTLKSITEMIFTQGTSPLFDSMIKGLQDFNAQFLDADGNLTEKSLEIIASLQAISDIAGAVWAGMAAAMQPVIDGIQMVLKGWGMLIDLIKHPIDTLNHDYDKQKGGNENSTYGSLYNSHLASLHQQRATQALQEANGGLEKKPPRIAAVAPAPGTGRGPTINQDFRGSRFDITQKFAEGYDADRISVAFAKDVGKISTRRLSSGFNPVFGIR